jgi:DUF2975 family protein
LFYSNIKSLQLKEPAMPQTPPPGPEDLAGPPNRAAARACLLAMIVIPLLTLLSWTNTFPELGLRVTERLFVPDDASFYRRIFGFGLSMIPRSILLYGLWRLYRMFKSFSNGQVFTLSAEKHLRAFAWSVLGFALVDTFMEMPLSAYLTWHNPPGERFVEMSVELSDLHLIFFSVLFFALTRVMAEGLRLARENAEFV